MTDSLSFDVVIVGGGPAGLATAIRLKQLCQQHQKELSVCVLEKGSQIGAHILSGAVIDPIAINELIPNWKERHAPIITKVTHDAFYYLTQKRAFRLPTPPLMKNHGNYIVSLGEVTRWLAKEAESVGVEIFAGFPGASFVFDEKNTVVGVKTQDMGRDKNGNPLPTFQEGVNIFGSQVILAEGCHGSLTQKAIHMYSLRKNQPQTYAIGLKELWKVPKSHHVGSVYHTLGWPLDHKTYGGGFLYYLDSETVALGFVIGLDYQNPYLNTFQELQRFKHHPFIRSHIEKGECLSYGARALNEGGWQSLPQLYFPGGLIVGCAAGFLNVPRIKGSHLAMKSGMLAAESVFNTLTQHANVSYPQLVENSWIKTELYPVRNIRPGFKWGRLTGLAYAAIDTYVFRGKTPWTFPHYRDHTRLKQAPNCKAIVYPKPDGKISFDLPTQLSRSQTHHRENQPCHLNLKDKKLPEEMTLPLYAGPETRYCPAGVYEYVNHKLIINGQNCLHCKTCDIKDPYQNIDWEPPEGGDGPEYGRM